MKKIIVAFMVFLGVMSYARCAERFHFDDCVRVTSGFYEGCVGRVKDMHTDDHYGAQYEVSLTCKNGDATTQEIDGKNLALQQERVCEEKQ